MESSQLHPENAHGESASAYLALRNYSQRFQQLRKATHITNLIFFYAFLHKSCLLIAGCSLCNAKLDQLHAHEPTLSTLLFCSVVRKRVSFAKASKLASDDNSVARARHSTFPCSGGVWKLPRPQSCTSASPRPCCCSPT